jgi:membrane peptidoglycan carboxypeptidase
VSTPDFTGSGRSHRRAPGPAGRPRDDSPRGDVYGGNGYGAAGYGPGGHRAENGYPRRDRQPEAGYGRGDGQPGGSGRPGGNGYDRPPSPRRGDEDERYGLRGASGGGRREAYGRPGDSYGSNGGSHRAARGGRRGDDYSRRDDSYGGPSNGGASSSRAPYAGDRGYGRAGAGVREDTGRRGGDYGSGRPGAGYGDAPRGSRGRDGYGRATETGYGPRADGDWDEDAGHGHARGLSRARFRRSGRDEYDAGGGNGDGGGRGGRGGRGGPRRPKRKGDWWRHWTWKKAVAIVLASGGAVVVAVAVWIGVAYANTAIPTDVSQMAAQQASTVYFSDGKTVVGRFGTVDRQVLTYNQIPAQLRNAVLAAEDRNFYNEGGISPTGIMRAAYEDVTGSGDALQGGSTITQQFVRNYYASIGTEQTVSRKIKEIFVAVKLAREKSKAWILTQYLNTIYFGDGAYGVQAAAKTFFGKPVSELSVAQDAMIAAMLNAPGQFDPTPGSAGYQTLVARWKYVVQGMVDMHNLSPQQAAAQKFPKVVSDHQQSDGWTGYNGYIMQAVENELESLYHYKPNQIDNGGLHIVTTFSKPMMNSLYATVDSEEHQMAEAGPDAKLPSYAHVGAVLEDPGTGAIVAMYSGPSYSQSTAKCKKDDCTWDMAMENREQVGSSFKPYVLSAARAQGMSVKTSILDGTSPLCVPGDTYPDVTSVPATSPGQSGCPSSPDGWHAFTNDEGDGASGPVSVVTATAQSLNTAYTDLTHRVGTQNVINMAKNFGVNTGSYLKGGSGLQNMVGQVGLALGTAALTVEEQANMFATLADNGEYNTPHVIQQITNEQSATVVSRVTHHEVLTPDENSDVDYALSQTTINGTGTNAEMSDGRPMIGKTGTTSTAQSAFFLGAIPQYSLSVGIFTNNQNASTSAGAQTLNNLGGLGGYGGDWPALIWHSFAQKEFLQLPVKQFAAPDYGGTTWNLMGAGYQQTTRKPHPSTSQSSPPHPNPTPSCTPSPLNNNCQGGTPPPSTSPPVTSSPPPTCPPWRKHCTPSSPLTQSTSQPALQPNGVPAADRVRAVPLSRGG